MSDNDDTPLTYYTAELLDSGTRETIQEAINTLDARWRDWKDEASRPRARLILGGTFTLDGALMLRCPIEIVGVEEGEMPTLELRSPKPYVQCFRFYQNEGVNDVTLRRLRVHGHTSDPSGSFWGSSTLVWRPSRIGHHAPIKEKMLTADVRGWRVEGCELWRCGIAFSRDYGFTGDIAIVGTEIHDHEGIGILIEGVENVLIDDCTIHNIRQKGVNEKGEQVVRNVTFGCGIKLNTRHYTADTAQFDFNAPANPPLTTATWTHSDKVIAQVPCSRTRYVTVQNSRIYNCEDDGIGAMIADLSVINCDIYDNDENGIEVKTSGRFIVSGQLVDGEWDIVENAQLINNRVHNNGAVSEEQPTGANGIVCSVPGTLVMGNVSRNNGNEGIQVARMKGRKSLWNVTVAGNRSLENGGDGIQVTKQQTEKTKRVRIIGNDVRDNSGYGISVGKSRFVQVGISNVDEAIYHQWADGSWVVDDEGKPRPIGCCRDWMSHVEEAYAGWSNIVLNNRQGGIHLQKSVSADVRNNLVRSEGDFDEGVNRIGIDANQTEGANLRGNRCEGQKTGLSANHALACRIEAKNQLEDNECNLHLHETNLEAFAGNEIGQSRTARGVVVVRATGADVSEEMIKRQNVIGGGLHII